MTDDTSFLFCLLSQRSQKKLPSNPQPITVVSYSHENFSFKWELPACLFPSTKKGCNREREWVQNRPFSFERKALIWIGRHCSIFTTEKQRAFPEHPIIFQEARPTHAYVILSSSFRTFENVIGKLIISTKLTMPGTKSVRKILPGFVRHFLRNLSTVVVQPL